MDEQYRNASNLNARIALHERFSKGERPLPAWIFDRLELPSGASVLEIGCCTGKFWTEDLDRIPESRSITLSDASPGMLREAESDLRGTDRFRFLVADVRELAFEDGMFDAVVANHVLHHVPDNRRAISESARVLGVGGSLYAATSGRNHLREMDPMMRVLDPTHPDGGLAGRIEAFSLKSGAGQLSPHFAEVTLWRHQDSLIVTEAQPLADYALSNMTVQEAIAGLSEEEIQARTSRLTGELEREIAGRGGIHITKDTGLFVARK